MTEVSFHTCRFTLHFPLFPTLSRPWAVPTFPASRPGNPIRPAQRDIHEIVPWDNNPVPPADHTLTRIIESMASLATTITALLTNDESTTLDFKQAQYRLTTDDEKSEFLKDLLAFTNANRHHDAYIIIGVTEERRITGITHHLRDADLQQLANSKTNHPIEFSYHQLKLNGHDIAAIKIPPQQRPIYLKKRYGKLQPNTVYLRRGSSTSIATPDEIATMQATTPTLKLTFADLTERRSNGTRRQLTSTTLRTPTDIPDQTAKIEFLNGLFNPNYYREVIDHARFHDQHKPIGIAITNTSSITAQDVRITLTITDPKHQILVSLDAPPLPEQLATNKPKPKPPKHSFNVHRTRQAWHLTTRIPKVQPHTTEYAAAPFYLGARTTTTARIKASMAADNLPQPLPTVLTVRVTSRKYTITLQEAIKRYKQ